MIHELDGVRWLGFQEPDYTTWGNHSDDSTGDFIADHIEDGLKESNIILPPDAKYLALAAGRAYPELKAARRLKVKPTNITLVDKYFGPSARTRFEREFPAVQTVESGMFEFLENPPATDFSLVTALGIEYVLDQPEAIATLIRGLPSVMRPGGIAAIFPYRGKNPLRHWAANGFEPLSSYTTWEKQSSNLLIYRLSPNVPAPR